MMIIKKIHFALWSVKMYFVEIYNFIKYSKLLNDIKSFQNIHNGKRCFVIGNGPSLTTDDLDLLSKNNEITFASNRVYKLFDKTQWRPTYYSVCDTNLFVDNINDVISTESSASFFPVDFAHLINDKTGLFFYKRFPFKFFTKFPMFNSSFNKAFGEGNTITYYLIQLAASMGFTEIYLIGCDFSYNIQIDENGKIIQNKSQKNYAWEEDRSTYNLPNLQANLYAYMSARKYCDKNGINIFNATRGGKLEVFKRVNLDNLLKQGNNN